MSVVPTFFCCLYCDVKLTVAQTLCLCVCVCVCDLTYWTINGRNFASRAGMSIFRKLGRKPGAQILTADGEVPVEYR